MDWQLSNNSMMAANSPQRLLPLISTVTTATTSKSGSGEPDLFFHVYFQNRILYIILVFFIKLLCFMYNKVKIIFIINFFYILRKIFSL